MFIFFLFSIKILKFIDINKYLYFLILSYKKQSFIHFYLTIYYFKVKYFNYINLKD